MKWRGSNSERADKWLERADLRHDRADWGAEGVILRLESSDLRGEDEWIDRGLI